MKEEMPRKVKEEKPISPPTSFSGAILGTWVDGGLARNPRWSEVVITIAGDHSMADRSEQSHCDNSCRETSQ